MTIKEIVHEDHDLYKRLTFWDKLVLEYIHRLETKINEMEEMMLTLPEFELKKYQTPWGDFNTYGEAARAMPLKEGESALPWTVIRTRIKSDEWPDYYFNT